MLRLILYLIIPNYITSFCNILSPIDKFKYNSGNDERKIKNTDNIFLIKENFMKKDLLDKLRSNKLSKVDKLFLINHSIYIDSPIKSNLMGDLELKF